MFAILVFLGFKSACIVTSAFNAFFLIFKSSCHNCSLDEYPSDHESNWLLESSLWDAEWTIELPNISLWVKNHSTLKFVNELSTLIKKFGLVIPSGNCSKVKSSV